MEFTKQFKNINSENFKNTFLLYSFKGTAMQIIK